MTKLELTNLIIDTLKSCDRIVDDLFGFKITIYKNYSVEFSNTESNTALAEFNYNTDTFIFDVDKLIKLNIDKIKFIVAHEYSHLIIKIEESLIHKSSVLRLVKIHNELFYSYLIGLCLKLGIEFDTSRIGIENFSMNISSTFLARIHSLELRNKDNKIIAKTKPKKYKSHKEKLDSVKEAENYYKSQGTLLTSEYLNKFFPK